MFRLTRATLTAYHLDVVIILKTARPSLDFSFAAVSRQPGQRYRQYSQCSHCSTGLYVHT